MMARVKPMSLVCTCAHTQAYTQQVFAIQSRSVLAVIKDIRCPTVSSTTSLRILELNQLGSVYGQCVFCSKGKP